MTDVMYSIKDIMFLQKRLNYELNMKGGSNDIYDFKAKLEQQRAQIVATNKELLNAGNLMKAMGNSLVSSFKGILPSLSDVINKVL